MPNRLGLVLALAASNAVLRPTPQSVVPPGPLSIVAKGSGKMLLDGKPVPVTEPAGGIVHARVEVSPGRHVLTFGETKVEFAAGTAPAGWKPFRVHPPAAECAACHLAPSWEFAGADACLTCHERAGFAKVHTHNSEVLAECQLCHLAHGSTEARHLKLSKENACKQCHG